MKISSVLLILILLSACKSETDKLIDSYESKVITYEELVDDGLEKNKAEINALGDDISAIMDAIGNQQLSDEQQSAVTGISLRFQLSLMLVQQDMSKSMDATIDSILGGLDSLTIEPIFPDSL
ncbi:MAG: hypothetical protein IPI31_08795 [Bacteroidetes bacterium]|nr:hypothetical protein [Bacteroidota bacterium]MBK7567912.1 hypothetical protein [Bacteroidota bacterium]MBP8917932.1 hypothetical protein [Chitinophagales bacterium]